MAMNMDNETVAVIGTAAGWFVGSVQKEHNLGDGVVVLQVGTFGPGDAPLFTLAIRLETICAHTKLNGNEGILGALAAAGHQVVGAK